MRTNKSRQKRYTRSSLTGLVLGGLILVFLAALAGGAYLMSTWGRRSAQAPEAITTQEPGAAEAQPDAVAEPGAQAQPAEQPDAEPGQDVDSRVTVVVMGVDNRPDEPVGRTDSIMVLTIDPQTGTTGMFSVARDLLVVVPGSTQRVKINTVHAIGEINHHPGGGPALLAETMSALLGYPVDYYVRINFDGFRQIIDQMGGVDIDVPVAINDPLFPDNAYGYDPLYIPAGHIHMDGTLALKFARTRHIDSDYGRERRQQQLVLALKQKMTQPGELARLLPRLPSMALTMANTVQTNMPIDQAIALGTRLTQVELQPPTSVVVDNAMGREENDPTLGFILVPDLTKIRAAAAQVFGDAPAVQTAGVQAAPTAVAGQSTAPRQGSVVVLNGTPDKGLATKVAQSLAAGGYTVVGISDADSDQYTQSWLLTRGDGASPTEMALERQFGITAARVRIEPALPEADMMLILGSDATQAIAGRPATPAQ